METPERSTLAEVAEAAGVSASAASLALRGKPGVSDATRQRVQTAAQELGYRQKQRMATQEFVPHDGPTIAVMVKSSVRDVATVNSFYGPVMAGVSARAREFGVRLAFSTLTVDDDFQILDPREIPSDVDGMLLLGAYLTERSAAAFKGRPLVLVDGYAAQRDLYPAVVTDNLGGAHSVTEHLIESGHERILLVGSHHFPSIQARRAGYLKAMESAGLEPLTLDGSHVGDFDLASRVVVRLDQDPSITGIVSVNDALAINISHDLAESGRRVPDDISIVGFDDIPLAAMISPGLTTAAVAKTDMGRLACSLLLHRIDHRTDSVYTTTVATSLQVRGSTRVLSHK